MKRHVLFAVASLSVVGCTPTPSSSACTAGMSVACACVGGGMGAQVCSSSGTYGACNCGGVDASAPTADSATPLPDAAADDSGLDAATAPPDAGASCPSPFVVCGGSCIDPREDRANCGASGACTGATAGESCGGACFAGRCVWDDCSSALAAGHTTDGVYAVDVDGSGPLPPGDAYCDMTTDGGGWTLVYKIRNDIPNISDPFWGMVDLGSGSALPTSAAPIPAGSHFEGPTREVRATLAGRIWSSARGFVGLRATMVSTTGATLFDVVTPFSQGIRVVTTGLPDPPQNGVQTGDSSQMVRVIGSSTGFAPVGALQGGEGYSTCPSSTCDDFGFWSAPSSMRMPIFGDSSIVAILPQTANTTTLFWIRPAAI